MTKELINRQKIETDRKSVYIDTYNHGVYNGVQIIQDYLDISNFNEAGFCTSGSTRSEWYAEVNGNQLKATTLKALKVKIDTLLNN